MKLLFCYSYPMKESKFKAAIFNHKEISLNTCLSGHFKWSDIYFSKKTLSLFQGIITVFRGANAAHSNNTLIQIHSGYNNSTVFYFGNQHGMSDVIASDTIFTAICNRFNKR